MAECHLVPESKECLLCTMFDTFSSLLPFSTPSPLPSSRAHVNSSNDTSCCHGNDEIPAVAGISRKVWMKASEERSHPSDDPAHEVTITPTLLSSAAYHSRIAKYVHRYVPTPTSRCTSTLVVSYNYHLHTSHNSPPSPHTTQISKHHTI